MNVLRLHHIGCAVESIDRTARLYAEGLGFARRSRTITVASQHVRVAFVEIAHGVYLELVEVDPTSALSKFLAAGYYHVCYLVDEIEPALLELRKQRCVPLEAFRSEAFDGHECQFVVTPDGHLIELAAMSSDAFAAFFGASLVT